ncbi:MAG: hypothetical protein OXD36_09375 [Rhodobacter sp.]|nr:hypothetical protein [Rhodobacter sp.]
MANRYSVGLRDGDGHCVEADGFAFRDGCLVFERMDERFTPVAVFGAAEIRSVRLMDDPIRRSGLTEPLDLGRGDDGPTPFRVGDRILDTDEKRQAAAQEAFDRFWLRRESCGADAA